MLYFITGNPHKLTEVQAVLPEVEQLEIDLPEIQELDAHKIIAAKLATAFEHHAGPFIVEDTSLYFDGMNGLPGPLIKWFLQGLGSAGVAQLAGQYGNGRATAKTFIGYAKNQGEVNFFEGEVSGRIVEPHGQTDFGWDPIFVPDGYDKTFAELGSQEKNKISHRRQALEKLKDFLGSQR